MVELLRVNNSARASARVPFAVTVTVLDLGTPGEGGWSSLLVNAGTDWGAHKLEGEGSAGDRSSNHTSDLTGKGLLDQTFLPQPGVELGVAEANVGHDQSAFEGEAEVGKPVEKVGEIDRGQEGEDSENLG